LRTSPRAGQQQVVPWAPADACVCR
jgi:hypothetical protein